MKENLESRVQIAQNRESKLAHFPIMLFASVMGLGGLALALKKASVAFGRVGDLGESMLDFGAILQTSSAIFGFVSMAIFALLLGIYALKIVRHFSAFYAEITHQVKINFFSAIPIGALSHSRFVLLA